MSDHASSPPPPANSPSWALSVAGVVGSLLVVVAVLAFAYMQSSPKHPVDAAAAAARLAKLHAVQGKQLELYESYAVTAGPDGKPVYRIPVSEAMKLAAARLGEATKDKPPAPARLSLAASPAGFTPPAPPATAPAPAAVATPPLSAPAAPATPAPAR